MLGRRRARKRGSGDEAEKPFWISYSDMMTAMMVLFLVVMAVALLSIPKKVLHEKSLRAEHQQRIVHFMEELKVASERYPGVQVDVSNRTINYGARAHFGLNRWRLSSQQEGYLRSFVPIILKQASSDLGKQLLKRVLVEGYTDRSGTYLYNLDLSLKRSEGVLCALMSRQGENVLIEEQQAQVLRLFVVGGYSFNNNKDSAEASRRVEMKLQFYGLDEKPEKRNQLMLPPTGACRV